MASALYRITRRRVLGGLAATVCPLPSLAGSPGTAAATEGFTVLEARPGRARIRPAPADETAIWGYGGSLPAR